ncbi:MAG TPA: hypothetical protein DCF63_04765, partial [Planctomycetaceae bacterium]|nr:hypothetical protein [Planctomycetaceae bacterium]
MESVYFLLLQGWFRTMWHLGCSLLMLGILASAASAQAFQPRAKSASLSERHADDGTKSQDGAKSQQVGAATQRLIA